MTVTFYTTTCRWCEKAIYYAEEDWVHRDTDTVCCDYEGHSDDWPGFAEPYPEHEIVEEMLKLYEM